MRALTPYVQDTLSAAIEPLVPVRLDTHPLGRRRRHKSDRECFEVMLVRLATKCSWEGAERLCTGKVSDTTVRTRRDEWVAAGVSDTVMDAALHGYDKIVGLDLSDFAVDGSLHTRPCSDEGTGKNPTDRSNLGHTWSILTDKNGIPFGAAMDSANRNEPVLLAPTLDDAANYASREEIETLWLNRGDDSEATRQRLIEPEIADAVIAKKRKHGTAHNTKHSQLMKLRWPVERTNSWLSTLGRLRRNTDRRTAYRLAQFALPVALPLTTNRSDWQ